MEISLCLRRLGVHKPVKTIKFDEEYNANMTEDYILSILPEGFFPKIKVIVRSKNFYTWTEIKECKSGIQIKPNDVLLVINDSGVYNTTLFRTWEKYFDCYVLHIK